MVHFLQSRGKASKSGFYGHGKSRKLVFLPGKFLENVVKLVVQTCKAYGDEGVVIRMLHISCCV